ncbi:MAG: GIY-YIG nuclease family protein [Candidatus Cloacimonetes bacterium]|jgi:hypothetical protein|nr:GIY-YIG nuclease family protein [Candidatus Cloacimonadota bacterium]
MKYKLNNILNLTEEEIKNCKIELNIRAGTGGEYYLERWLKLTEEEKESGITECSYWGWYGKQKNFNIDNLVFSFIQMNSEEWLLISVAKILAVPKDMRAVIDIQDKFKPLFGRLIMSYKKGNTYSRYAFNMNTCLDNCVVKEILPCIYSGETFNGYDNVNIKFDKLSAVFAGKIMPTYFEALQKITGIYCLTDHKTGKLYIGSATGEGGVAQRWGNYLNSKHGGNVRLIELFNQKGKEYFEKYFTFTLIEYFGLSYDPIKITTREQYWKKCFGTIENGYNDN